MSISNCCLRLSYREPCLPWVLGYLGKNIVTAARGSHLITCRNMHVNNSTKLGSSPNSYVRDGRSRRTRSIGLLSNVDAVRRSYFIKGRKMYVNELPAARDTSDDTLRPEAAAQWDLDIVIALTGFQSDKSFASSKQLYVDTLLLALQVRSACYMDRG